MADIYDDFILGLIRTTGRQADSQAALGPSYSANSVQRVPSISIFLSALVGGARPSRSA
jgi:hypothetical protein